MGIVPPENNKPTQTLAEGGPAKLKVLEARHLKIGQAVTIARSPTRYQSSGRPSKPTKAQQ